jgi:hypothetical protein
MYHQIGRAPTSVGVEWLFNSARDICHYRRGPLNPKTVQDLIMFMCTSRFEVQEEQRAMLKEYLSNEEIQVANEAKATPKDTFDPVSYDEKDDSDSLSVQIRGTRSTCIGQTSKNCGI